MNIGRLTAVGLFVGAACGGSTTPALPTTPSSHAVPVPRVSAAAGAGVAWFATGRGMTGIASDGRQLTLEGTPILNASNGSSGLRSADGGRLYIEQNGRVAVAGAADGRVLRSVLAPFAGPFTGSVSIDGRWLWLTGAASLSRLLLIDTDIGAVLASGSVPAAGSSSLGPSALAMLALPDARLLLIPPGGAEVILVSAHAQQVQIDSRTSKASASPLSCNSPDGETLHTVADGTAAVGFCPFDGTVWWLDLDRFQVSQHVPAHIGNPFWGSPSFSSDGRSLYVYDEWDGYVSAIDSVGRRLLTSTLAIRTGVALRLPFVQDALAKGPNFSSALSPDGQTLFVAGTKGASDGVYALATSTWALRGHWLQGHKVNALWAGGDGAAIFVMESGPNALEILDPVSGAVRTLPGIAAGGFAAG